MTCSGHYDSAAGQPSYIINCMLKTCPKLQYAEDMSKIDDIVLYHVFIIYTPQKENHISHTHTSNYKKLCRDFGDVFTYKV